MTLDELKALEGKFVEIEDKYSRQIAYLCEVTASDDMKMIYADKRYGMYLNDEHTTYDAEFSPHKIISISEYSLDDDKYDYLKYIKSHIDLIKESKRSLSFEIPSKLREIFGYTSDEYRSAEEYLSELKNG